MRLRIDYDCWVDRIGLSSYVVIISVSYARVSISCSATLFCGYCRWGGTRSARCPSESPPLFFCVHNWFCYLGKVNSMAKKSIRIIFIYSNIFLCLTPPPVFRRQVGANDSEPSMFFGGNLTHIFKMAKVVNAMAGYVWQVTPLLYFYAQTLIYSG